MLRFAEISTYVSDLAAAVGFYRDALGLTLAQQEDDFAIFDCNGIEFVLMAGAEKTVARAARATGTALCLQSDDLTAAIARLRQRNVTILTDIQTVPQGRYAIIADPDGTPVEIIEKA